MKKFLTLLVIFLTPLLLISQIYTKFSAGYVLDAQKTYKPLHRVWGEGLYFTKKIGILTTLDSDLSETYVGGAPAIVFNPSFYLAVGAGFILPKMKEGEELRSEPMVYTFAQFLCVNEKYEIFCRTEMWGKKLYYTGYALRTLSENFSLGINFETNGLHGIMLAYIPAKKIQLRLGLGAIPSYCWRDNLCLQFSIFFI